MVFGYTHFGDEIGRLDHCRLGVAAGDDDMQALAPRLQRRNHFVEIEIIVAQCDVQLVEHQQADRRIGHQIEHFGPCGFGRREADSIDIRQALKLYRVADYLLIALFGLVSAIVIVA